MIKIDKNDIFRKELKMDILLNQDRINKIFKNNPKIEAEYILKKLTE